MCYVPESFCLGFCGNGLLRIDMADGLMAWCPWRGLNDVGKK